MVTTNMDVRYVWDNLEHESLTGSAHETEKIVRKVVAAPRLHHGGTARHFPWSDGISGRNRSLSMHDKRKPVRMARLPGAPGRP